MADLMKLLMRAAEVLASTGSNVDSSPPSESRQKATLSDEESNSENDEKKRKATISDEESNSENDDHDIKEPSKLIMPPKKRLGLMNIDDHHINQEEDDDQETLSKLNDPEQEVLLEAPATKKIDQDFAEKSEEKEPQTQTSQSRPEQEGALAEIVTQRQDAVISRDLILPTTGSGPHNYDKGKSTKVYYDRKWAHSKVASFEEIKEITIPRSKLLEWHAKPFFNRLIEGCFVRLAIGESSSGVNIYRLCLVRYIDDRHPSKWYHFDGKITDKYLVVVWGDEYALVRWKMSVASNSPPTKQEFNEWAHAAKISMGHRPTKHDVFEKKTAIEKTTSFVNRAPNIGVKVTENDGKTADR